MTTFQERFKGKTTVMPKEGINSVISGATRPVAKQHDNLECISTQHFMQSSTIHRSWRRLAIPIYRRNQVKLCSTTIHQCRTRIAPTWFSTRTNHQWSIPNRLKNTQLSLRGSCNHNKLLTNLHPNTLNRSTLQIYLNINLTPSLTLIRTTIKSICINLSQFRWCNMSRARWRHTNLSRNSKLNLTQDRTAPGMENNSHLKPETKLNILLMGTYEKRNKTKMNLLPRRHPQQVLEDRSKYRPYTLREYEEMKKTANAKLGGLGPNMYSGDWLKEKEKLQKRQEFAEQVKQFNNQNITAQPQEKPKKEPTANPRSRAIEFAKNIPKPPTQPRRAGQNPGNQQQLQQQQESELEKLERQHLQYLQQLDQMK